MNESQGLGGIDRVVLTTDLSQESLRAFDPVVDLARRMKWKLTLLHVVHDPVLGGAAGLSIPQDMRDAHAFLEKIRAEFPSDVESEAVVASDADVVKAITDYARDNNAMLALSTHGRTGVRRLVVGSVAEEILRRATVPVFCIPHPH